MAVQQCFYVFLPFLINAKSSPGNGFMLSHSFTGGRVNEETIQKTVGWESQLHLFTPSWSHSGSEKVLDGCG